MGTAKSKALREFVAATNINVSSYHFASPSHLILALRCPTLLIITMFLGEIEDGRAVIQYESLHRLTILR